MEKNRGNYNEIVAAFRNTHSVDKTVIATGAPKVTVQKVLITEGLWESRRSREIAQLKDQGLSTEQIAEKLHVTVKAVQAYMPYSRSPYGSVETRDALRSKKKREKMQIAAGRQVASPEKQLQQSVSPGEEGLSLSQIEKTIITNKKMGEEKMKRKPLAYRLHLELVQDETGAAIRFSSDDEDLLRKRARYHSGFSRDIIAPSDMTLHALHYAIQKLFGWGNSHLREFSLMPDDFRTVTDGKTSVWEDLCGVYFRFPDEDDLEQYWDDDYEGKQSFKNWLKQKYTGPYYAYCTRDTYFQNQFAVDQFNKEFSENTKIEIAENLNDFARQVWLGGSHNCLMERIRLSELLVPVNAELPGKEDLQDFIRNSIQHAKGVFSADCVGATAKYIDSVAELQSHARKSPDEIRHCLDLRNSVEPELLPFVHELMYQYDFGDGWCIKITCEEEYCIGDSNIDDTVNDVLHNVITEKKPICIESDGMNLVDDVGGVFGLVDFVKTLYGDNAAEAEEMKIWAESLGWSSRMNRPEKML